MGNTLNDGPAVFWGSGSRKRPEEEGDLKDARKKSRSIRRAWWLLAVFAVAIGLSLIWEGPRTVYAHAVVICLDCIGLI